VGVVDVSTLGKIELQGRDVTELLNRIYINRWDTLAVGRCRYGVMLREDGVVRDDGTTSRLDETHYLMTTTTANAVAIMQYVERLLQVDWPGLDVYATSVTEQWAAAAISGPNSRALLARLVDVDVSNEGFPFLAVATCALRTAAGPIPARLFRMSYSGELAYEVHVPSGYGRAMWDAIVDEGRRVRPDALRHRGDEHAARREGPCRHRLGDRRPHDGGRPRHGEARQSEQVVRRQAAARACRAECAGPLATGGLTRARRHDTARREDRRRSDRAPPNPMLGT
jgi:hypothetical protein